MAVRRGSTGKKKIIIWKKRDVKTDVRQQQIFFHTWFHKPGSFTLDFLLLNLILHFLKFRSRRTFLESPETFRADLRHDNSLCILKTKTFLSMKLYYTVNISVVNEMGLPAQLSKLKRNYFQSKYTSAAVKIKEKLFPVINLWPNFQSNFQSNYFQS